VATTATPTIVTRVELETPRSADQMLAWVDAAHARFSTPALKAEAREGKHFSNELVHEAQPMALFAQRYFGASPQVIVTHVIGDQNYDGIVEDRRRPPGALRYLEATTTLRTYEDSLRMELLTRDGHVAAYGPVVAEGSKHNRTAIHARGVAQKHEDIRDEHLGRVRAAVTKKAKKEYNPNTALIVAVDDSVPFREPADIDALDALAKGTLIPLLQGTNIRLLAIEGSNGLHLCYDLG
jgi:hypothetical protein